MIHEKLGAIKRLGPIILVIIIVPILSVYIKSINSSKNSLSSIKEVKVQEIKGGDTSNLSELSGTLQPFQEVTVSFEVSGIINSLNIKEGSNINVDDILASIDDSNYELQVQQAQANTQKAQAAYNETAKGAREQQLAEASLKLEQAETTYNQAVTDFKRNETLYKSEYISQSDYEKSQNNMILTQKDMNTAQEAYSLVAAGATEEEKQQANAAYKQAVSAEEQAQLALSKTSLKSPMKGVVISKNISQGQLVSSGTPACTIANIDKLKVDLPVPDNEIPSWKIGDKVVAILYDKSVDGSVTNIFSATNENTGTINVEVTLDNTSHNWRPGQVVNCEHSVNGSFTIFVPKEAVISNGSSSPYVFLLKNNKAVKTNVEIGDLKNNKLEIKSGVKKGQSLITDGAYKLSNGDKVNVVGSDNE
ncbi:efflux RND transporter periplasmic adaptor subunit [Clostridium sp. WILCCON 0269]|uniref:Efflux RND transporter periplasmic adaptor subunit n=1 Tax=Candidatus Clostridium eludens TaxID=3381663 RepID=A0ABW8SRU9_9CLOT